MQLKVFFALCLTLMLGACAQKTIVAPQSLTLAYKQTQCSDAWTSVANDTATLQNVRNYLAARSLPFADLRIVQDGDAINCLACVCPTGKTIYVTTTDTDSLRAQYGRLGFR